MSIEPIAGVAPYPCIRCDQIGKAYGAVQVVRNLSLDIAPGEFVSLLGPSGSGKTTLLMMLAGFEEPTAGDIWLDGRRINEVPPYRRNMGVVFQNYALFPHMTAAENVGFPLRMRGVPRGEIASRVARALEMVQLGALKDRRPTQLSGGQQQRVALARALVFEPRVVLMDEPLGALDKRLREQMQLDIRDLHRRLELTVVFVTHDQSEALTMSDRIAVFNAGRIEQIGTPVEIYDRPESRFVAQFIGETNLLEGTARGCGADGVTVELENGLLLLASGTAVPNQRISVSVRPERIQLNSHGSGPNSFASTVTDSVYRGDHLRVKLDTGGCELVSKAERRYGSSLAPDANVHASFAADDCWIVPN